MVRSEDGPRGASTEPKRIGLLVECEESLADEGVPELPAATARKIYAQLHKAGRA